MIDPDRHRIEQAERVYAGERHPDPELDTYFRNPERHARIGRLVDLCMAIGDRPCTGDGCDEGRPCPRHDRAPAVAERYVRLKDRARR